MQFDLALGGTIPRNRRVWVVLALSIVLIAVMSAFLSQSLETLNNGSAWVTHTERVRYQLAKILQSLSDLGNGIAAYQLTRDPRQFDPAESAARDIDIELDDLRALVADDGAQREPLRQLIDLGRQRETQTQEQRERALRGDLAGVQAAIAGGESKRLMDAVRAVISQMQEEEKHLLDVHREATRNAYNTVEAAIWGAAVIAALLLFALTQIMVRDSRRLQRVQEELATTLRSVGDAVIATDDVGSVRFINTVAEELTGWTSDEARGRPLEQVFNIFNEDTHAAVENPVARVLRENSVVGLANHTVLRARDGRERPIEDSGAPIRGVDGAIRGVVLVFRDATEERAARQALINSRDALREADRRKDVFLATLSHELRNPLAPIRTATRVLETPHLTRQDLERSRSIISRQVRHMASLLDDLLDISRITRGVLTLKNESVDLHGLLEAAIETAQPAISAQCRMATAAHSVQSGSGATDPGGRQSVDQRRQVHQSRRTNRLGRWARGGRTGACLCSRQWHRHRPGDAAQGIRNVFTDRCRSGQLRRRHRHRPRFGQRLRGIAWRQCRGEKRRLGLRQRVHRDVAGRRRRRRRSRSCQFSIDFRHRCPTQAPGVGRG
jgi:PAS domain S-box-containing protein